MNLYSFSTDYLIQYFSQKNMDCLFINLFEQLNCYMIFGFKRSYLCMRIEIMSKLAWTHLFITLKAAHDEWDILRYCEWYN